MSHSMRAGHRCIAYQGSAKRLVLVPACLALLILAVTLHSQATFGLLDSYLYSELSQEEMNILIENGSGHDLLSELI